MPSNDGRDHPTAQHSIAAPRAKVHLANGKHCPGRQQGFGSASTLVGVGSSRAAQLLSDTSHIMRSLLLASLATILFAGVSAAAPPSISIAEPTDGATLSSPFKLRFAVQGMTVAPAGEAVANSGHHHLLIDTGPVSAGEVVPSDATHLHFGDGRTETEVSLSPGTHKLTAQFADGAHRSYGPAMSQTITVTVK
jgi:hypothetical protein